MQTLLNIRVFHKVTFITHQKKTYALESMLFSCTACVKTFKSHWNRHTENVRGTYLLPSLFAVLFMYVTDLAPQHLRISHTGRALPPLPFLSCTWPALPLPSVRITYVQGLITTAPLHSYHVHVGSYVYQFSHIPFSAVYLVNVIIKNIRSFE